jgi:hypothetical protein
MTIEEKMASAEARAARLREELAALEAEAKKERDALRASVHPVWKFTFSPADPTDRWDTVWDPACQWWQLTGEIVNRDEMRAAGHGEDFLRGGGMRYLFNTLSNRIVKNGGGGTLYITGESSFDSKYAHVRDNTLALLSLVAQQGKAADVTSIIVNQEGFHKNWR